MINDVLSNKSCQICASNSRETRLKTLFLLHQAKHRHMGDSLILAHILLIGKHEKGHYPEAHIRQIISLIQKGGERLEPATKTWLLQQRGYSPAPHTSKNKKEVAE